MQLKNKQKILCVDDEVINLELFKLSFEDDYDIFVAENPFVGLKLIKEHDIKIVVTDFKMPEMNGIEFVKKIKNLYSNTVCILITAFIESNLLIKKNKSNLIFRYILKPWKYEEVKTAIDEALQL